MIGNYLSQTLLFEYILIQLNSNFIKLYVLNKFDVSCLLCKKKKNIGKHDNFVMDN